MSLGGQNVEGTLWSSQLRLQSEGEGAARVQDGRRSFTPPCVPICGWGLGAKFFSSRFFGLET